MAQQPVTIYLTSWCPYCSRAQRLLQKKGIDYTVIDIEAEPGRRAEMRQRSGRTSVPQIFIGDRHIGGCDDLHALEAEGGLDPLLAGAA
jgi:glutaredoxin 3